MKPSFYVAAFTVPQKKEGNTKGKEAQEQRNENRKGGKEKCAAVPHK